MQIYTDVEAKACLASAWMSGSYNRGLCFQLQDRTQFSDGDLIQLKRYWDRGMTSLGSVCREKITAAANQLSVDTEIVKVTNFKRNKEKSQFQQYH